MNYKLVNRKEYAVYIDVNGVTKTIPAKGYLCVKLNNATLSVLKAKYRDILNFNLQQ